MKLHHIFLLAVSASISLSAPTDKPPSTHDAEDHSLDLTSSSISAPLETNVEQAYVNREQLTSITREWLALPSLYRHLPTLLHKSDPDTVTTETEEFSAILPSQLINSEPLEESDEEFNITAPDTPASAPFRH